MTEPPSCELVFLRARGLTRRRELKDFALTLSRQLADGRGFVCLLSDDRELQRLNREFLQKDYPADVLSFPMADGQSLGEMAISVDRAREQAARLGHGLDEEVRILMLHGLLHLIGMDHENDRGRMRRSERAWRKRLGLPAGLIERASR